MTFGGSDPKPSFEPPRPQTADVADDADEFGWAPTEPEPASAAPTPRPPSSDGDGWSHDASDELLVEDDSRWRGPPATEMASTAHVTAAGEGARLLSQCEGWLQRALQQPQPAALARAIKAGGCNALSGGFKCVLCGPKGPQLNGVSAFYRAQTGRVLLCADRLRSEEEVASALSHELVHAYDHCRRGLRVPLVRTQVPWALDCPTEACSEVRAYSLATYKDAPSWVDKRTLVYRSALASLLSNPGSQCGSEGRCTAALAAVFERCAADAAPFNDEGRTAEMRGAYPRMDLPAVPTAGVDRPPAGGPPPAASAMGGMDVRGMHGFSGSAASSHDI
jgi:inner membrane protease ATP23